MQREPRHEDYTDALDWKWEGFARKTYIVVELLPAVTALWAFDSWRHNELDGLVYNATGSNFSTSSPNTGVMLRKLASFDGIDTFLLVFILYQFILAIYNLRGIFKHGFERAIDVDLDHNVSTTEWVRFAFKILPHMLSLMLAANFVACEITRTRGLYACMATLIWFRFLFTLVPFQTFGLMMNTLVQMIVLDVVPFLSVFILLMLGFAASFSILVEDPSADNHKETWHGAIEALFYVSLGEVGGGYDGEAFVGIEESLPVAKLFWYIWCVLSTVVAMNL